MRTVARRVVGAGMALAMVVNTACYSFVPAGAGIAPAEGEYVKVRLTAAGTDELARFLGPRVQWAEGTLSSRAADGTLVVGVQQVRLLDGIDHFWSGQGVVTFAPAHVAEVQRRALDKGRTRMATVVATAGLVGLAVLALGSTMGRGSGDPGIVVPPP